MRTETLTFDVPLDILAALKIGTQALETDMRRTLAVRYYKNKRLSLGKSAKLAGMNRLDFMDYLATEGAVVFDYDESDLQEELKGMETLKGRKIDSVKRHRAWQKTLNKDQFFKEVFQ